MKYSIRLSDFVISDVKGIVDYIKEENEDVAMKIGEKILDSIDSLSEFPNRGTNLSNKISTKTRYKFIMCDRYMIVYFIEANFVTVYRVFDTRRDYKSMI